MLQNLKNWFAANQKIALIGAVVAVGGYFAMKMFRKRARAKRLTRRA